MGTKSSDFFLKGHSRKLKTGAVRVVICTAPRMLGGIRSKMAPQFKQFVYAELDKNLVHRQLEDLPEHFKNVHIR